MSNLFDWKELTINNEQFYDLAFWKDRQVIYYITESRYAILNLSDDEYKELFSLELGVKLNK